MVNMKTENNIAWQRWPWNEIASSSITEDIKLGVEPKTRTWSNFGGVRVPVMSPPSAHDIGCRDGTNYGYVLFSFLQRWCI